jgi:hypothetical protein
MSAYLRLGSRLLILSILLFMVVLSQPKPAFAAEDPNCADPDGFFACVHLGFGAHNCYDVFCKATK